MRNFDLHNRYLDNNSNPLHGCVQFNVKDGNTVANIYDSDNVPLANPQITDEYGRTQYQVFVEDDVIAYFYKYIGTGVWSDQEGINTNDVSKWALQYTAENINDVLAHITSDSAMCIENIAALRALDVDSVPEIAGVKVITLLGYDSIGDKEAVNYIWNPNLTDNDDNGAVIQGPNLTGRWVMVKPTEHCDCRHYGIFPSNSRNTAPSMTPRFRQWIDYCNAIDIKPYFSAHGDYRYYKYNNLSFTCPEIDVAPNVEFADSGTSNIWTTEINGNPYFHNHATMLASKTVKTSWGAYNFIRPEHVIVDSADDVYQTSFTGCTVDLNVPLTKACTFNECTVNCNATLSVVCTFNTSIINSNEQITSGCYFNNCKITERMFFGSPYIHVDNDVIADFNDFEHKQYMWLLIKGQQQQVNFDWEGLLTQSNPWETVIESDRWLLNYKTTNPDAVLHEGDNAHTYFLENCTGEIKLEGKAENTYVFKDCEMTVNIASTAVTGLTLSLQNSTVSFKDNVTLRNLTARSSVISGEHTVSCDNFSSYGSILASKVKAKNIVVKDSQINAKITSVIDANNHFVFYFDNNIFNAPHELNTEGAVSGISVYNGVWSNNIGNIQDPIIFNDVASRLYSEDDAHTYTYKNNTGTFIPSNPRYCGSYDNVGCYDNPTHLSSVLITPTIALIKRGLVYASTDSINMIAGIWIGDDFEVPMKIFSVGKKRVQLRLTVDLKFEGAVWNGNTTIEELGNPELTVSSLHSLKIINPRASANYAGTFRKTLIGPAYISFNSWTAPGRVETSGVTNPAVARYCVEVLD